MKHSLKLAVLLATVMAVPVAFAQGPGASLYKAKCQMCHGPDGKAATPMAKMMKVPSFEESGVKKKTNAALTKAIEDGVGKMPAYKSQLSNQQVKDLVTYIRVLEKK